MNGVREFFELLGAFWVTVIAIVLIGAGVFVGGWQLNWWLAASTVNHQYQVNQGSQQYQDTYKQQADKTYEQLAIDKYDISTAKSSGDTTAEQDAYAAAQSDIRSFCTYAQELTPATRATLGPNELGVYNANC